MSKTSDLPRILVICQTLIPSATVGVIEPLKKLSDLGVIEFRFVETLKIRKEDIAWADSLICIRGSEDIELSLVEEFRRLGRLVIYFLDDDLLNVPPSSASGQYFSNEIIKRNIKSILRSSSYLWTTNKNIKKKYDAYCNKSIVLNAPALLLDIKTYRQEFRSESKVIIGFSGGYDHVSFLEEMLTNPIREIIKRYAGKVQFEFFGAKPFFVDELNLKYYPYESNHANYKKVLSEAKWDIGLAPLQDTEFHSCKYFNKFLEYGSIRAAGIYSNVEPFTHVVENETNGLLADNTQEDWLEKISRLIEDINLRGKIQREAREDLQRRFTLEQISSELISLIPELITHRAPKVSPNNISYKTNPTRFLKLYKLINIFKREGFIRGVICLFKKFKFKLLYYFRGMGRV